MRSLAVRVDFLVVASFWIVADDPGGTVLCGGPLPPVAQPGAKQDSHPEQGGGGLRTWVPKAQEHHVQSSWEVWGLPLTRPQSIQGQWERCVQTLNHPTRPPHGLCCPRGHGVSVGAAPQGLQGAPVSSWSLHSQTGPGISPPAQLRACFDFYSQFWQDTRGTVGGEASLLW